MNFIMYLMDIMDCDSFVRMGTLYGLINGLWIYYNIFIIVRLGR
jgi:hypothetical protein